MKSWIKITGFTLLWAIMACNSAEQKDETSSSILLQPPFAGITDSIGQDKGNRELYIRRAGLLNQQGEHALAFDDLEAAWKLAPSEPLAEARVNSLFMMGKNNQALLLLKDLLVSYPENLNLKRRMGEALLHSGQYEQAIETYDKMIAADSLDFESYYEKGLLYLEMKDSAAALRELETSFRIQPLQITALSLANMYAERKNPRALELADMVINRDSSGELADPVFIKGIYYANIKNTAKALEQFNQVIRMDWKFHEAYIEKGIIYFDQKNLDEALQQFKLASTVTNTFPDAYYWQGRCYEELGMEDEAAASYGRAYALDKSFTEAIEGAERVRGIK